MYLQTNLLGVCICASAWVLALVCVCIFIHLCIYKNRCQPNIHQIYKQQTGSYTNTHVVVYLCCFAWRTLFKLHRPERKREREWRVIYKQMRKFFKKMNMEIASVELSFYVIIFVSLLYSWSGIYIHIILQHEPLPTKPCTVPWYLRQIFSTRAANIQQKTIW